MRIQADISSLFDKAATIGEYGRDGEPIDNTRLVPQSKVRHMDSAQNEGLQMNSDSRSVARLRSPHIRKSHVHNHKTQRPVLLPPHLRKFPSFRNRKYHTYRPHHNMGSYLSIRPSVSLRRRFPSWPSVPSNGVVESLVRYHGCAWGYSDSRITIPLFEDSTNG